MLLERLNEVHWPELVVLEMFLAGIAAGAYMVAAMLEWTGRGRSPLARSAHAIAFPLVAVALILLILDLQRMERFWHMAVMSQTLLPMIKLWSPMNAGMVLLTIFSLAAFVSFLDLLIGQGLVSLGGWRQDRTLHGRGAGRTLAIVGALAGFGVAAYSGVLLSVTNIPGWAESPFAGAVYVATAMMTGVAALVLIQAARGQADADVHGLAGANAWLIGWWLLMVVIFLVTLGSSASLVLAGIPLVALVLAIVLGGLVPLGLRFTSRGNRAPNLAISAALVLAGGFFLRYAIVMGPQSVQ